MNPTPDSFVPVNPLDGRLGVALRLEAQRREMECSILVESSGNWLQVNDFQQRFWNNANRQVWLSASAPTASGKTFLVLQWLIDQMAVGAATIAVYLAPTRALVSEIETNLQSLIGKDGPIEVSSLPLGEKYISARAGGRRLIFVFTQERLHHLANVLGNDFSLDLLIVDEAHKIGDDQRGVILQDAIERASRANQSLKIVFISPPRRIPKSYCRTHPMVSILFLLTVINQPYCRILSWPNRCHESLSFGS